MPPKTDKPFHQPVQDSNELALKGKEKESKTILTNNIRSLLDSDNESETMDYEDNYYPSEQEQEDEMYRGLVDGFAEAKKSGLNTSEVRNKTDIIIKIMLKELPDKKDMILRSIVRAQSLIFPLPGILTSGPSPFVSPVSKSITKVVSTGASIATADSVLLSMSAACSAFREVSTPPIKSKTITGTNVGYIKDTKFSVYSHTPGISPNFKMCFHRHRKNGTNEKEHMKFKLPGYGNCHSIAEMDLEGNIISDVEPGTIGSQASVCGKNGAPAVKRKISTGHVTRQKDSIKLTFPTQTQGARDKEDVHLPPRTASRLTLTSRPPVDPKLCKQVNKPCKVITTIVKSSSLIISEIVKYNTILQSFKNPFINFDIFNLYYAHLHFKSRNLKFKQ